MGKASKMHFEEKLAHIVRQGADVTAEEWMKAIEVEYGKVPLIFRRMSERPEVLISHLLYKGTVAETSPLDPKYVELISMAVGAALKCPHCTGYHMQAALKMGATREEILEVILLSGMISNSSVLANAYRIVDEKLEKCIPCETKGVRQAGNAAGKKKPARRKTVKRK
ncbi:MULTISPECIES: carboxymuconolactone decarboxylase family protein [unclassified Methanoregula]|uniref:carboxymuconolactone decarboxylase family protein n=1 Tax=unclassified Methanoregula TaxID=2649730 RepID=UPI0009CA4AEC|nr:MULTISPECIES: carboxymuconolactone decarboxylase family protein [unclassified Methanoregula]OPX63144.1 MAG: Carboxymuconolactone decarboxylase family protein [Methanoregula sp. PtaB.Bin085]OPY33443.1 MAG: Carboxymuconolactone decarboxylase family protein [Methanoregula sp. PtaU1.Bin006]